jgi:hypothetical protein
MVREVEPNGRNQIASVGIERLTFGTYLSLCRWYRSASCAVDNRDS